jgi:hypothetical protein
MSPRPLERLTLPTGELAPRRGPAGRVLHVEGGTLWAARGLDLLRSTDGGGSFELVARAPGGPWRRRLAEGELSSRFLGTGFHGLAPLPGGGLLAIVRGALLHKAAGEPKFSLAHRVERGSHPLNVCVLPSGRAFFGEYFSNSEREEVHVYGSETGREWDVVGSFQVDTIRHVHGIHHDPPRGGLWVLTGDEKHESGLWWTDDEFRTLEPIWRGTQQARAITLFAESWGLVVPMDSPRERNYVQHFDPRTGAIERLAELPGSVLHAGRSERLWLLSTAVERSRVNTSQRPALFASADGLEWSSIARLERDRSLCGSRSSLLQRPTIVLPSGRSTGDALCGSGRALRGAHGQLLTWSESEILERLRPRRDKQSA